MHQSSTQRRQQLQDLQEVLSLSLLWCYHPQREHVSWGLPIIEWSFGLKWAYQDQQTRYPKITDNACGIILSLKSFVISSSYFQPANWHIFLHLDFNFRKDLVHCAAEILLTPELFRHWNVLLTFPSPSSGTSPYPKTKVSKAFSFPLPAGTVMWGDRDSQLYISKTSSFPKR